MVKKKVWITALVIFALCTSLVCACASMHSGSLGEKTDNPFSDVKESDWFCQDVQFVNEKGLMNGTTETVFSPNETMTRAMVVTVLWRFEDQPICTNMNFNDVKSDAYYYNAVAWAAENKIVSGYDENTFGSDDDVTREQLAAILYRFAGYKGYDISKKADLSKYSDSRTISDYAVNALEWTVANEIITGTSENTISPQGNALRCQVAAILKRFCNTYSTYADKENKTVASGNEGKSDPDSDSSSGGKPASDVVGTTVENPNIPYITISEVTASLGEDVCITATIKNNPGILGMTLTLNFDETALELEKAESGNAFRGVLDFTPSKTLSSGSRFVWDGIEIKKEQIKDGEILVLHFKVLDTAKEGSYSITLNHTMGDIVDNDLANVELQTGTGYITIKK